MASEEDCPLSVAIDKYNEMSSNDIHEGHYDYGPYIEPLPTESFQPSCLPRSHSAYLITPAPVYLSRPPNLVFQQESECSITSYESRNSSAPGSPLPGQSSSDDSHEMLAALHTTGSSGGRHHRHSCQKPQLIVPIRTSFRAKENTKGGRQPHKEQNIQPY